MTDVMNYTASDRYVTPKEPEVREKLEWFRDQKLAFMVHWGTYSQLGMCESWPLTTEDKDWARKEYTWEPDDEKFRAKYFAMNQTFNPIRFDPDEWADFAKAAGFRYFIFTTKHHDGFCMYDSRYTSYKITAADCPYHSDPKADVTKQLFDAFRARGIAIAPYFSKPDWHCPWYWAEGMDKPVAADRNPTYYPPDHPEVWDKYVEYTHNQLTELVENYGPVEILWLDGGQVNPIIGQDVRLRELAPKLRKKVPGLIFADRTVGGEFENYITPEHTVPGEVMDVPWESCIPVGKCFSYRFDDEFKTPRQLVELVIKVVTRGGNLALDLGAQPDGRLPRRGMESLLEMGKWLDHYSQAIYATRAAKSRLDAGRFGFNRKGSTIFALAPLQEGEAPSGEITVPWSEPVCSVKMFDGKPLAFACTREGVKVNLPVGAFTQEDPAIVLRLETEDGL